jgi:hypothetical protein
MRRVGPRKTQLHEAAPCKNARRIAADPRHPARGFCVPSAPQLIGAALRQHRASTIQFGSGSSARHALRFTGIGLKKVDFIEMKTFLIDLDVFIS